MIRERLLPQLELVCGTELDIGEQVFSCAWDPWFGEEAAFPECFWFVV